MGDLSFETNSGDIFMIIGGSGCGKSTLLKHLIGMMRVVNEIILDGNPAVNRVLASENIARKFGTPCKSDAFWADSPLAKMSPCY
jgi:phospholipid/cholesterol/gamma-HCH transport system ATP-binding protein